MGYNKIIRRVMMRMRRKRKKRGRKINLVALGRK